MCKLLLGLATIVASLVGVASALADTTTAPYQATFVEIVGGPNHSPFTCPAGTSCGSGNIAGIGHASEEIITFNACGPGCHVRLVTFDDGSTLLIREEVQGDFHSPGNSGERGYVGFGLPGDPQFLDITQTITGGTGRLAGATGKATGTVKVAGGMALITASGSITLG